MSLERVAELIGEAKTVLKSVIDGHTVDQQDSAAALKTNYLSDLLAMLHTGEMYIVHSLPMLFADADKQSAAPESQGTTSQAGEAPPSILGEPLASTTSLKASESTGAETSSTSEADSSAMAADLGEAGNVAGSGSATGSSEPTAAATPSSTEE